MVPSSWDRAGQGPAAPPPILHGVGRAGICCRCPKASPGHCWARCVQTHTKALPQPVLPQSRPSPASLWLTCLQHSMPHVWSGPGGPLRSSPGPSVPGSSGRVGGRQAEATVGKVGQQAGKSGSHVITGTAQTPLERGQTCEEPSHWAGPLAGLRCHQSHPDPLPSALPQTCACSCWT